MQSELPDVGTISDPPPLEKAVSFSDIQKFKNTNADTQNTDSQQQNQNQNREFNQVNTPDNTPQISSKKKLFDSLFPKWELSLYPSGLTKAIATVERHDFIRNELHRLKKDDNDGNALIRAEKKAKPKGIYQMRMMGLERLPISELNEMKDSHFDKKLPALTLLDDKNVDQDKGPSVKECLVGIIHGLETLPWLSAYEQKQISHTFIINFSRRYDNIQKLMISSLTAKQNRKLAFTIVDHIRNVTMEIMEVLRRKKSKMQSAGLFSLESNSDRLISTFRTMLNRKINNQEILEFALEKMDLRENSHTSENLKIDLVTELNSEIDKVTHPIPKLEMDHKLKRKRMTKTQHFNVNTRENLNKIMTMQFTARGIMPVVSAVQKNHVLSIEEDLVRLITDNNDNESILAGNVWVEEKFTDELQKEARNLLQYEKDSINHHDLHTSEDPILRAHAHVTLKPKKTLDPRNAFKVPDRYLRRKDLKVLFDFDSVLNDDTAPDVHVNIDANTGMPKKVVLVDTYANYIRPEASKTSAAIAKIEIVMDHDILDNPANDFNHRQETKLTTEDLIDENLSRFKEVEELYTEIMKSVPDSRVDKEEAHESVLACNAAPLDNEVVDVLGDPHSSIFLRKIPKVAQPKPNRPGTALRDADGIPISGAKFQIFLSSTRQKISPDFFRKNRKKAMKKIMSSKYHFKYNYGGYIPPRVTRNGVIEDYITSEDYDEFLGKSFCDFVPLLLYQEKRKAERLKELEEEERERMLEKEEIKLLEKLENQEKERIEAIFTPQEKNWNANVIDYIEENRDPPVDMVMFPPNRPGLQKMTARDLQQKLEEIWSKLRMKSGQKLDMGIKYGNHKYPHIDRAMSLWTEAANLVFKRETLLDQLEQFEIKASNPKRFFEKGDQGSSRVRLKEAQTRQNMLKPLYQLEADIETCAKTIFDELKEIITYNGEVYTEKMKIDYRAIIAKTSKIDK